MTSLNQNDPHGAFVAYWRRFDVKPDVTISKMGPENGQVFVKKVDEALKRNKPFTADEENTIERKTFKAFYDLMDGGDYDVLL